MSVGSAKALTSLQNHARSVLHRDMNAMSTEHTKQESSGQHSDGHVDAPITNGVKEESATAVETQDTTMGTVTTPIGVSPNLDQSQQSLPNIDATEDIAKPEDKNEIFTQEQIQDANTSGAQSFNDEDLFGFDPSPLPTPQPTDFDMDDADGGVALPITEAASVPNQAQGTTVPNVTTENIDDLFGENPADTSTEGAGLDASEQQDTDVNSLLPGLEFYANENNATPGGLPGAGDVHGSGMGALELPDMSGTGDGNDFMMDAVGDGQTTMMGDSTFDDWLSGLGGGNGQNGDGQANGEDAQFDANFFNLD